MTLQNLTIAKIQQLPDHLAQEVNDFIDFLVLKQDRQHWQQLTQFSESSSITESDFSDYLSNLNDYEEKLSRGEIQW
jgi:hypothetical protein